MQVERFSILKRSERLSMAVNLPYGPEQPRETEINSGSEQCSGIDFALKGLL